MKKFLNNFFSLIVFAFLPINSFAMLVSDPLVEANTSTALVKLVAQIGIMSQQLATLKQELDMLKQLNPSQYEWSDVQNLINNLGNQVEQSNGIAYSAQNIAAEFQQAYPGYKPPSDYNQQYQQIVTSTINTLNGVLQAMGSNANDFTNENNRLQFLQQQAQSATGQTQAIQAAAQIASEQVSQLQLIRQAIIAQTNAQTTYYAAQLQKDATSEAAVANAIDKGSTDTSSPLNSHPINNP